MIRDNFGLLLSRSIFINHYISRIPQRMCLNAHLIRVNSNLRYGMQFHPTTQLCGNPIHLDCLQVWGQLTKQTIGLQSDADMGRTQVGPIRCMVVKGP